MSLALTGLSDLVEDRVFTSTMVPHGKPAPEFRDEVVNKCYLKGLLVLACGSCGIRFAPPLVITRELIDEGLDILEHAIAETEEEMFG